MINLWRWFLNLLGFSKPSSYYANHDDAVIIACFYNPEKNEYRSKAFKKWYDTVQGLNYRIVELLIGPDATRETPIDDNITVIRNDSYLWHKESLLNLAIKGLPKRFKYVFWVDTDLLFTNKNWLVDSVAMFESGINLLQPFEFGIHLDRDEVKPSFDVHTAKLEANEPDRNVPKLKRLWRSFCATWVINHGSRSNNNYDRHGHVGFVWGMKRDLLDQLPLYDRALIGGADHIIAHAAVGEIPHACIARAYEDNLEEVEQWSTEFYRLVDKKISFVSGDVYHLWHGDLVDRKYFERVKQFTKTVKNIKNRDKNGLHVAEEGQDEYVKKYYQHRDNDALDPMNDAIDTLASLYMSGIMDQHQNDHYGNNNSSSMFNDAPVGLPEKSDLVPDSSMKQSDNEIQFVNPNSVQAEITDETFVDLDSATFS